MRRPWFQFFPGDWMSDPGVRMSSLAARGLWMEMLCIMHQASSPGYLEINGYPVDPERLANLVGARYESVTEALHELLQHGVYNVDGHGRIYSRRMVRDEGRRAGTRERVRRSRSKGQCNTIGNASVTPDVTPLVTPSVTPVKHALPESSIPDPKKSKSRAKKILPDGAFGIVDTLIGLVESNLDMSINGHSRHQWAEHIDKLRRLDKVSFDRQRTALQALGDNWGKLYWPEVQSGKTWRDKFPNVEAAMKRAEDGDGESTAIPSGEW